jgi:hypothetical protein
MNYSIDVGDLVIQVSYMGEIESPYNEEIGIVIAHDKVREPYEYYQVQWLSDGIISTYCRDDLLKVRNDYHF